MTVPHGQTVSIIAVIADNPQCPVEDVYNSNCWASNTGPLRGDDAGSTLPWNIG